MGQAATGSPAPSRRPGLQRVSEPLHHLPLPSSRHPRMDADQTDAAVKLLGQRDAGGVWETQDMENPFRPRPPTPAAASGPLQVPGFPAADFSGGLGSTHWTMGLPLPPFLPAEGGGFVVFVAFLAQRVNSGCHGNCN